MVFGDVEHVEVVLHEFALGAFGKHETELRKNAVDFADGLRDGVNVSFCGLHNVFGLTLNFCHPRNVESKRSVSGVLLSHIRGSMVWERCILSMDPRVFGNNTPKGRLLPKARG